MRFSRLHKTAGDLIDVLECVIILITMECRCVVLLTGRCTLREHLQNCKYMYNDTVSPVAYLKFRLIVLFLHFPIRYLKFAFHKNSQENGSRNVKCRSSKVRVSMSC